MIAELRDRQCDVAELCQRYGVRWLDVFGSAASPGEFDPRTSDVDLLVEFDEQHAMGPADQYFGLRYELHRLLGRDIDLVTVRSLRNPYLIRSIERTRQVLYAS